jgi:hypothetical protein
LKSIGLHGEGADANEALKLPSTIARLAELREIVAQYPKGQVYNQDETGLYFRCLSNRSYLFGAEDTKRTRGSKSVRDKSRFKQWFDMAFLPYVRAQNDPPVLLIMDNHSSHNDVRDPRGQVRIEGLTPNVTSRI